MTSMEAPKKKWFQLNQGFLLESVKAKTRQDKARQGKTRQDTPRQGALVEVRKGKDKTRRGKARQDKTRQDKTRQDKTRQDKTRQDKTRCSCRSQGRQRQDDKTRQDRVEIESNWPHLLLSFKTQYSLLQQAHCTALLMRA